MSDTVSIKALALNVVGKTGQLPDADVTAILEDPVAVANRSVDERWNELARQGHGPQRHGAQITEEQLEDRVTRGLDPVGEGATDAFTALPHRYGRHATKINRPEDYVKAEHFIRSDPAFAAAIEQKTRLGQTWTLVTLPIEAVLGANYAEKVSGKTRNGPKREPSGVTDSDFKGGSIKAFYRAQGENDWVLHTLYPWPRGPAEHDDKGRILPDPLRDVFLTYCNVEAAEALDALPYYLGPPERSETAQKFRQQLRYVIERNVLEPTQFEALTDEDFDTPQDLKHWLSTIEQRLEAAAAEQGAHEESHNHEQA